MYHLKMDLRWINRRTYSKSDLTGLNKRCNDYFIGTRRVVFADEKDKVLGRIQTKEWGRLLWLTTSKLFGWTEKRKTIPIT